jgi:RNA polymerase sigma-70 factor, ECF subfamily
MITAASEDAYSQLIEPHRNELRAHCYRMLGSVHDAEDALQDALLRAWKGLRRFEGRSSVRTWLYRIATNACLDLMKRRPKQPAEWPEPFPDELLEIEDGLASPDARYERRESVELAFVAALQHLPATQRAALLLRDVLGFSAAEVAELLDTSTAGVNSALQRARAALDERGVDASGPRPPDEVERSLVRRFVDAWQAVDVDRLVALLREDAVMTMPPEPGVWHGRAALAEFFSTVPAGGALHEIRLVETRANRQPALAAYVLDRETGVQRAYGIMVLAVEGGEIAGITGYAHPSVFAGFRLPQEL